MRYSMHLLLRAFDAIARGGKTVEIRVNDAKRKQVKAGDEIEFTKLDETHDRLVVLVTGREDYSSFVDLIDGVGLGAFSSKPKTKADALNALRKIYSEDEERRYGVVAFRVKVKTA